MGTFLMSDLLGLLTETDRVSSRPDIVEEYRTPSGSGIYPLPLVAGESVVFCGTVYKALGTGTSELLISCLFIAS